MTTNDFERLEHDLEAAAPGAQVLEFKDAAELKRLLANVIVYTVPMGSRVVIGALPQPASEPAATGP